MNTPEQDWQDRAMSYSLDDDEQDFEETEADLLAEEYAEKVAKDKEFQALLEREAEHQERERLKKECYSGLLALGLLPRSLAVEYVRRGQL